MGLGIYFMLTYGMPGKWTAPIWLPWALFLIAPNIFIQG